MQRLKASGKRGAARGGLASHGGPNGPTGAEGTTTTTPTERGAVLEFFKKSPLSFTSSRRLMLGALLLAVTVTLTLYSYARFVISPDLTAATERIGYLAPDTGSIDSSSSSSSNSNALRKAPPKEETSARLETVEVDVSRPARGAIEETDDEKDAARTVREEGHRQQDDEKSEASALTTTTTIDKNDDDPVEPQLNSPRTQTSLEAKSREGEEEAEEEDASKNIVMTKRGVLRNGCPFGWHSPSKEDNRCFHLSLIPLSAEEAEARCMIIATHAGLEASRGALAVPREGTGDADFLCSILARGNNKRDEPNRILVGSSSSTGSSESSQGGLVNTGRGMLVCSQTSSKSSHANFRASKSSQYPFACVISKPTSSALILAGLGRRRGGRVHTKYDSTHAPFERDTYANELENEETLRWTPFANHPREAVAQCEALRNPTIKDHASPVQQSLPVQIHWRITSSRKKGEPVRYYAVWQSKGWFGWLDFWVDYLVKYKDFRVAPVGKNVKISHSASGRTGYSGTFASPATPTKYGTLVVLSRLPIPSNVLSYFPNGTLVNQVYVDPLVRVPLGDKIEMVRALDAYAKRLGCASGTQLELGIMPESYDAAAGEGCRAFLVKYGNEDETRRKLRTAVLRRGPAEEDRVGEDGDDGEEEKEQVNVGEAHRGGEDEEEAVAVEVDGEESSTLWVVKGPLHGGTQVSVMNTRQVRRRLRSCGSEVLAREELVQKLVSDTLVLNERKFDLRVFVLVASTNPLLVYVHREPYFRASMKKLAGDEPPSGTGGARGDRRRKSGGETAANDEGEEEGEELMMEKTQLVTNTHVQKKTTNSTFTDWEDHIWLLDDKVKTYARRVGAPIDFWERLVFPRIKRSVKMVIEATATSITDRRFGQWKLFGVDFVVDANMRPLLLDWNSFPGFDWSYRLPWTLKYRRRILDDAWRLVLDVQRGAALKETRSTPSSGGFELVFSNNNAKSPDGFAEELLLDDSEEEKRRVR